MQGDQNKNQNKKENILSKKVFALPMWVWCITIICCLVFHNVVAELMMFGAIISVFICAFAFILGVKNPKRNSIFKKSGVFALILIALGTLLNF